MKQLPTKNRNPERGGHNKRREQAASDTDQIKKCFIQMIASPGNVPGSTAGNPASGYFGMLPTSVM